jgi:uncharacterized protein with GYD domain
MVRYLTLLKFTEQGIKNLQKSTARAEAFRQMAAKAGATVEAQYWTTGAYDGALLFNAENETTALRCVAALAAAGNVRTHTFRAFDSDEFDAIGGGK